MDRSPLCRIGLRSVLDPEPGLRVVLEAASESELVERILRADRIERLDPPLALAIVEDALPAVCAARAARELREVEPRCQILALSISGEPSRIAEVLVNGAAGYALKTQPVDEILDAARRVIDGAAYLPPAISRTQIDQLRTVAARSPLDQLTRRERQVFELFVQGQSNAEIATRLGIARRTVEAHRHHIMRKLAARSAVDLVRLAVRHGVIV